MTRFAVLLALFLAPTPPGALSFAGAADWPQLHGPGRDGHSAETKLDWNWPKDGPKKVWTLDVGKGWAGPVVAGDRLIFFTRIEDEEVVQCLDPATGKEKWRHAYKTKYRDDFGFDDGPRATPTIGGDRVFTLGPNGDFGAVELATGKPLWSRNLLADYKADKGFFGAACSPLVVGDRAFVNVGGKGAGVVCFNAADGK